MNWDAPTGDGGHSQTQETPATLSSVQVRQMMRLTESTRARLMLTHGYTMLALGLALFYIRATMTNLFFYVFGGAFALLLVAGSLLFIAGCGLDLRGGPWLPPGEQAARLPVCQHGGRRLQCFADSLPGDNDADGLLRDRGLCPFAQCRKIQSRQGVERQQARTEDHVPPGSDSPSFSVVAWWDLPAVTIGIPWRACRLFLVHGVSDAAHDVFS